MSIYEVLAWRWFARTETSSRTVYYWIYIDVVSDRIHYFMNIVWRNEMVPIRTFKSSPKFQIHSHSENESSSEGLKVSSSRGHCFTWRFTSTFLKWRSALFYKLHYYLWPLVVDKFFQFSLTFWSLPVTWCANSLTFNNCKLCPHCIYVFYIYLRTNSDLCHLQHKLIGFYNRDEKCLQRGTDCVFK